MSTEEKRANELKIMQQTINELQILSQTDKNPEAKKGIQKC